MKLPSIFKRKQSESTLPAEIEEYYQSERRERAGVAWLLAGGTLIATVLLALALFFGGRWIYDKVANRNQDNTSEQQGADSTDESDDQGVGGADTGSTPGQTGTSSAATQTPSNTTAPASNPSPSTATAPATTGSSRLPNTGPDPE